MFIIVALCIFGAAFLVEMEDVTSNRNKRNYLENKILAMESTLREDIHLLREDVTAITEQFTKIVDLLANSNQPILSHKGNSIVGNGPSINAEDGTHAFMQYPEQVNRVTKEKYRNKRSINQNVDSKLAALMETMQLSVQQSIRKTELTLIKSIENIQKDINLQFTKSQNLNDAIKKDIKSVNVKVEKITADVALMKLVTVFDRLKIKTLQNGRVVCHGTERVIPEQCDSSMWFENNINLNQIVQNDIRIVSLTKSLTGNGVQGKLELFYREEWGTVCAKIFNDTAATVACRHLGYANGSVLTGGNQGLSSDAFGQGRGKIRMDNVGCTGSESSLFDCSIELLWVPDCGQAKDVGITCFN